MTCVLAEMEQLVYAKLYLCNYITDVDFQC